MAGNTSHYGLKKLTANDTFSSDGYKFTDADRDQMDALLYLGAEGHHHTGASTGTGPTLAPSLTLSSTGGTLAAGVTYYYVYTYVNEYGQESTASPVASQATPALVDYPDAAILSTTTTGGSLVPGPYYYVLSAYQTSNTVETRALNPSFITVPVGTSTNKITLTLPDLPSGATGFNVYRKKPGGLGFFYVTSIDMNVATPPTRFDDTGLSDDCNRTLPNVNSTNSTSKIEVCLPGATPTVPAGYTWKIYRTTASGQYTNSLLVWVSTETIPGTVDACYEDTGTVVGTGTPPVYDQFTTSPSKVLLTDAAEVQGTLPMGLVSGYPFIVEFHFAGVLSTGSKPYIWICEFPNFYVVNVRLTLMTAPTSTYTMVDVNKGPSSATPTFTTIFTTQANRPTLPSGQKRGVVAVPDVRTFVQGDAMTFDIDQAGGGSPADLKVLVYGYAYGFSTTTSFTP